MARPLPDIVILCGGLGTRLRSSIGEHPKCLAEVQGRPFLEWLVDWAQDQGFHRFVFCIGYKGSEIRDHFTGWPGMEAAFSEERELLGTAGALKLAAPFIRGTTFVALNGDSLCRLSLNAMLDFHHKKGAAATVAAAPAEARKDGGYMQADAHGRILAFKEKDFRPGLWLNAGVYAMQTECLEQIPANRPYSLENDLFPRLLGHGIQAFTTQEQVQDIGTHERLEAFRKA